MSNKWKGFIVYVYACYTFKCISFYFRLVRYGNPDEPIRLKYFKYTRDKVKIIRVIVFCFPQYTVPHRIVYREPGICSEIQWASLYLISHTGDEKNRNDHKR